MECFVYNKLQDIRNTVGNIPMEWFKEYEHIGYNLLGRKIAKPKEGDELDEFLEKNDNPDYWFVMSSNI
jgi:ribosome biogenesis protein ERB1